jgi:hypothetical protein
MPIEVRRLAEVVRIFQRSWESPDRAEQDPLGPVRDMLRELAVEALTEDPEMVPVVVGLIHLLVDVHHGAVPQDAASEGLSILESQLSQGWLPPNWSSLMALWVLRGGDIQEGPPPNDHQGCSLIRWRAFCDHYAAGYGKTKFNPVELEQLWSRVESGKIELLERDIHLNGANGVVWFTDERKIRGDCPAPGQESRIDGNQAYDRLGLDWSRSWEEKDEQGRDSTRAVLLSVPVARRLQAARGSHSPTALDGWGCLGFVPGDRERGGVWPSVGSFTVNPVDGQRSLPEGVHGPLDVGRGERCSVEGCGRVARTVSDRLEECGKEIVERAIARL